MSMSLDSQPPSPRLDLIPISTTTELQATSSDSQWHPILEASNQIVLYNPASHALTVTSTNTAAATTQSPSNSPDDERCPYCHRPLSDEHEPAVAGHQLAREQSRVPNYFHLLAAANESSTPMSPPADDGRRGAFDGGSMAQGYFKTFFREVKRLGMGANGTVLLCEHVLDGNPLGELILALLFKS